MNVGGGPVRLKRGNSFPNHKLEPRNCVFHKRVKDISGGTFGYLLNKHPLSTYYVKHTVNNVKTQNNVHRVASTFIC